MKFFYLMIGLITTFSCGSSKGPADPFLAILLPNGSPATLGPYHQVRRFTADGSSFTTVLQPDESGKAFLLPAEQGFFLLGNQKATLVDGTETSPVLSLPMQDKQFIAAVVPNIGHTITVTETGLLEHWQQDQKVVGMDRNLMFPMGQTQIESAVFSANGIQLLTLSTKSNIASLWDVNTGFLVDSLVDSTEPNQSAAIAPNQLHFLVGSTDGVARIWSFAPPSPHLVLLVRAEGHEKGVTAVAFSHTGYFFVTGDGAGTIRLWEYAPGLLLPPRLKQVYLNHQAAVQSVAFSTDDQKIISAAIDGSVRIRENPTEVAYPLKSPNLFFQSASFDPNGEWLATTSPDEYIRLWKRTEVETQGASATPRAQFYAVSAGQRTNPTAVQFFPDGNLFITEHKDGFGRIWDLRNRESLMMGQSPPLLRILYEHLGPTYHIAFSADGKYMITGSQDRTAKIWGTQGTDQGKLISTLLGHFDEVTSAYFSSDSNLVVTTSRDKSAILWDIRNIQIPQKLSVLQHTSSVTGAFFSDSLLITTSTDGFIEIWDIQNPMNPRSVHRFIGPTLEQISFPILGIASYNDGKQFMTMSNNWMYQQWDTSTQKLQSQLIPLSLSEPAQVFNMNIATKQPWMAITTKSAILIEKIPSLSEGITLSLP